MKKIITLICSISVLASATDSFAQPNKYPESLASVFTEADATVTPAQPATPVIAVPVFGNMESSIFADVRKSGGAPVAVLAGSMDYAAARDAAASFDGFILTDAFKENTDLQLLKAIVDRNVPIFGSDSLLVEINAGLKRVNESYPSMDAFVAHASVYKKAKQVMGRIFTLDTHNDQPCSWDDGASLELRMCNQVSLPKLVEGYVDGAVMVDWIEQKELDEAHTKEAMETSDFIVDGIYKQAQKNIDYCTIVHNEAEARAAKALGKKALFIAVENGYALGTDIAKIRQYRDLGMIYLSLCHTGDNYICHTSSGHLGKPTEGLTKYGKKVVKELNDCGVIIDLSHSSEQTFWDVAKLSKAPFVCTHSGAMAIHAHDRNLTDDQLRELARRNGVIQIYTVSSFMSDDPANCSIDDVMKHLMHCVEVAGIDHVGVGTDFDGGSGCKGMNGSNDCINLTVKLIENGFSDEDIIKIWGGNFFRVMGEVQKMAKK